MKNNLRNILKHNPDDQLLRYEQLLNSGSGFYLDTDQFCEIIDKYISVNLLKKALLTCGAGLKQHPKNDYLLLKKVQVLIELNKTTEAYTLLLKIPDYDPTVHYQKIALKGIIYTQQNKTDKALVQFQIIIDNFQKQQFSILFAIGLTFVKNGTFTMAQTFLEKAFYQTPKNEDLNYYLAYTYEKLNNTEKAIEMYLKCIDINPFNPMWWYNIAVLYSTQQNVNKAIEAYEYAIAIDNKFGSALFNLAILYNDVGNLDKAKELYIEAYKIEPHNAQLCYMLGLIYEKQNNLNAAFVSYKTSAKLDNTNADTWYGMAIVKYNLNAYPESLKYIKKAVKINKQNSTYFYALAKIYSKMSNFTKAETAYLNCIKIEPDLAQFWLGLAEFYTSSNAYLKALGLLEKANSLILRNPFILMQLSALQLKLNNLRVSKIYLKQALIIDKKQIGYFLNFCPQAKNNAEISDLLNKYVLL